MLNRSSKIRRSFVKGELLSNEKFLNIEKFYFGYKSLSLPGFKGQKLFCGAGRRARIR